MTPELALFVAGILGGIALALVARGVVDQVFIVRYLRGRRRRPIGDPHTRFEK